MILLNEKDKRMKITEYMKDLFWQFLYKLSPKKSAELGYNRLSGGEVMHWNNPQDLREKIIWLQFNSDTSLWTLCADKYRVREYVREKGCGDTLNDLYGYWKDANEIDYDSLPESFVLKTNNSCGQMFFVRDKSSCDKESMNRQLNKWLKKRYGYKGAQMHYLRIKPLIIAEKLMINTLEPDKSLVDYKIWCFNGAPEVVWVAFNRTKESYEYSAYDLDWNNISEKVLDTKSAHYSGRDFPRPLSFDRMLECAKALSKPFKEVRVDYYDIDGHAVFGELTFTAGNVYFTKEYYNYLGTKVCLSE